MCITIQHKLCPRCKQSELAKQELCPTIRKNMVCPSIEEKSACYHCGYGEARALASMSSKKPTYEHLSNIAAGVVTYALIAYPEDTVRLFLESASEFPKAMQQLRRDIKNHRVVPESARLTWWNENRKEVEVLFSSGLIEWEAGY